LRLDKELADQAAWALQLNRELERLTWARWLYRYAAKLYHFALLLTGWLSRRLKRFLPAPGNIPKN